MMRPTFRFWQFVLVAVIAFLVSGRGLAEDRPSGLRVISEPDGGLPLDSPISTGRGVAPLSVHFTADFATQGDMTDRFRNYHYLWDFDDPESGTWNTSGKEKGVARGPVAAHVFERPGVYNVTLEVSQGAGVVTSESYTIEVIDPDLYYAGENTICVTHAGSSDFAGAPAGARLIATDDLSEITQYAQAGRRILLRRGSSWSTDGLTWPRNGGPVTIGAYGSGARPEITVTGGHFLELDQKQDWRIMDIVLRGAGGESLGGNRDMQRLLFLRVGAEGFRTAIGWSHWVFTESDLAMKRDLAIVECDLSESTGMTVFVSGERLVMLGNVVADSEDTHVVRIWHAYRGVVAHNDFKDASTASQTGRHALKMHGPNAVADDGSASANTDEVENRTQYNVVSDNVFGSSGPWPVAIGPPDAWEDDLLSDILFERNRVIADHGTGSQRLVQVALHLAGRDFTVRNNVLDGTGAGDHFTGIWLTRRGIEPPPEGSEIYSNTIYRGDAPSGESRGIEVDSAVSGAIVRNNLVSFPYATGTTYAVVDDSSDLVASDNLLTDDARFTDPDNPDPLARGFRLQDDSPAVEAGGDVPVYDDFDGNQRPAGSYDLGAFQVTQ